MHQGAKKVDLNLVLHATHYAKEAIDSCAARALAALTDLQKKERLAKPECPCCFYIHKSRIGGASMTTRPCGCCDKEVLFSSTATDILCPECALKKKLCKRCGADLNLKMRRKL